MPNNTPTLPARTHVSVFPLQADIPCISRPASFPVSRIACESHQRVNLWAGLVEGGQILSEAEAHKGAPLTQAELRMLQVQHLDAYDPDWAFGRRGISEEWLHGWEHAFALAAQQAARACDAEPLHGIGIMSRMGVPASEGTGAQRTSVRFRQAQFQVHDPEAFFQGVWEGQLAALDAQGATTGCSFSDTGTAASSNNVSRQVTAAWCFDELLDLVVETGNYGLDYVVGYVLGYSEGLLSGRTYPPASVSKSSPALFYSSAESRA